MRYKLSADKPLIALFTGFDQLIKKSIHNINEFFKLSPVTDGGAKEFLSKVDAFLIGTFHGRKGAFANFH